MTLNIISGDLHNFLLVLKIFPGEEFWGVSALISGDGAMLIFIFVLH